MLSSFWNSRVYQPLAAALGYYGRALASSRGWLMAAAGVFALGLLAGLLLALGDPARAAEFLDTTLSYLKKNIGPVEVGNWRSALAVFGNNIRAALILLITGAFFGLTAALSLFTNGFLIGTLVGLAVGGAARLPAYLLPAALLPHGVVEIPGLFIAGAWGLKLGLGWLGAEAAGRRRATFGATLAESARMLLLIALLFLLAAFLEVMVTGALVKALAPPGLGEG